MNAVTEPSSDTQSMSILAMYRMAGLRNALLYLHDVVRPRLPVARINAILCATDGDEVISVADTSLVNVSNKYRAEKRISPLVAPDRLDAPLLIGNLAPYKERTLQRHVGYDDMPHLHHHSLLRLPLFYTSDSVFLINFWSDETDAFSPAHSAHLEYLLGPLVEDLQLNLSSIALYDSHPLPTPRLSGAEKIRLRPGLATVRRMVEQVADTDSTVLILGETGSGKEAVADMCHELSSRRTRPFIKVNCGAIPESLLDSELFGHEKGAFTGALSSRPGFFEMAEGGTLFLDEIGEMPAATQVRLLRVLDGGSVRRIGGSAFFPVNVRVIAAAQDDLPVKVRDGRFRRDLWFRLAVFPVQVPPLRFCMEDIPPLVAHFLREKSHAMRLASIPEVEEGELYALYKYEWPGNVRELEHIVERSLILHKGKRATHIHFSLDSLLTQQEQSRAAPDTDPDDGRWPSLQEHENSYIAAVLKHCGGKLTGKNSATAILKIQYATLRARMQKLGLRTV